MRAYVVSAVEIVCLIVVLSQAVIGAEPAANSNWKVIRLTVDANEGIDLADFNNDGKLDVSAGRNWYPAPDFTPHPLRTIDDWNGYVQSNGEFAYDVDKDGHTDVISGSYIPTEIYWYKNPGPEGQRLGHMWQKGLLVDSKLSQNEGVLFHDLDGDKTPEFIVNSWNKANPLVAWKLTQEKREIEETRGKKKVTVSKEVPVFTKFVIGERANGHGMAIGDINNDGRDDILVGMGWYEQPKDGPWSSAWKYHADWNLHAAVPCIVKDLNGDKKNDLIIGEGHNYGLHWWEATGQDEDGTLTWKQHLIDKSFSQPHALHMADLDGDGNDELITGKRVYAHNGKDPGGKEPAIILYYKWDVQTQKFNRNVIDDSGKVGIGLQIRTGDLNGDGRLDIAVAGKSGTHILLNPGDGKKTNSSPKKPSF